MLVPVDELFVDTYQRPLNELKVKRMVADWDPVALGSIAVSLREDGQSYVIDGQHRATAAKQMGLKQIPALVWIDLTRDQEAQAWVRFQTGQSKPNTRDVFKGRVQAGDEIAVAIDELLRKHRYEVNYLGGVKKFAIAAIGTVEKVYIEAGAEALSTTLELITEVYDGDADGEMVNFIGSFLARYQAHPMFQYRRLADVLKRAVVAEIKNDVRHLKDRKGGKPGTHGAMVILDLYNKGLKTAQLPVIS